MERKREREKERDRERTFFGFTSQNGSGIPLSVWLLQKMTSYL